MPRALLEAKSESPTTATLYGDERFQKIFKLKALDNMSQTVDALTAQIQKAQTYLDRAHSRDAAPEGEAPDDASGLTLK